VIIAAGISHWLESRSGTGARHRPNEGFAACRIYSKEQFMITVKSLGLADANMLIQAGIARANEIGSPSTIAVVDVGGTVIAQARMDGASLSSVTLAYNKAYTAVATRLATSFITTIAQPGGDFYGIANGLGGRAIIFPGGVPITVDGEIVGAVGASGGNGAQDEDVAQTAASAISKQ
jgi:uncharacterized protein GlcG (DUF336 family)